MFFRGQTIGKYRILSPLGSGGFGSVYLAEDTWIDKKVALKVPHKQGLDFTELLKEPRLLASMSHPNIVTVLTAEKQDDIFFIVMEYVQGETLEQMIVREGALDVPARSISPARSATRSITRTAPASCTGICGRATCWCRTRGCSRSLTSGPRASSRSRRTAPRHRQPALHGARTVPRQGRLRQRHLLRRRHDVSDADRNPALRHAVAGGYRSVDEGRARRRRRACATPKIPKASPTSSSGAGARAHARYSVRRKCSKTCWPPGRPRRERRPARRAARRAAPAISTSPRFNRACARAKSLRRASAALPELFDAHRIAAAWPGEDGALIPMRNCDGSTTSIDLAGIQVGLVPGGGVREFSVASMFFSGEGNNWTNGGGEGPRPSLHAPTLPTRGVAWSEGRCGAGEMGEEGVVFGTFRCGPVV